ncbi:MAG: ATP-binding protein [Pseudomonadota bacterium]
MVSRLPLPDFAERLRQRIRARPDTEFQQALIRLCVVLGFYLYFSLSWLSHSPAMAEQVHFIGILLTLVSLGLLVGSVVDPQVSVTRRSLGMLHDFSVATYMLAITNETGAPVAALYLWVTLGNGFRYGLPYLYVSTVASATGFILVYQFNPFWHNHFPLWLGIWFTLIAIPLYTSSLLRQLHSAVRHAHEASLAKSSFLANMSHELRTPLNGVIGVADLLAETPLNKEQKELAQIIRASANTLLELVDKVLDISRIESGRLVMTEEDFDLHRLVNGTVAMLTPLAQGKGLVLAAHIAPQTPFRLHGDARHLRQILVNLIGNAIKFTEHGRVDVTVRPIGPGDAQRVRFEVVDTGIGIPEAMQARIFDSFTQADASITRRYGGSGLGTAIAKHLVESLGGQIGLHSREGEGTTVWFELPFTRAAAVDAAAEVGFDAPMRVAILADPELAARLQAVIGGWGVETRRVLNTTRLAAELAACLADGTPLGAVVVARSMLPGDPVAFLGLLRDDPGLATLPVILIEPDDGASPARDAQLVQAGFASVLRTPVNSTLLYNAVHAVVSQDMPSNVVSLASHFESMAGHTPGLRILVAEDNPVNQRVIRGLLEHAGHHSFLAHDGEEALAMLESADPPYDLAIVDMHMPGLSGTEVVQRWRFMETGHLPVIMLTADAREEAQAQCAEAGADAFLTKPVNSRELVGTIARLARPGPQATAAVAAKKPHSATSTLDASVLDDLAALGGTRFIEALLASFNEESTHALHNIERALQLENYSLWHDQLHKLKGGARDVGALHLAEHCAEAERIRVFELATATAREKFDAVLRAHADAQAALQAYLERELRAERI